MDPSAITPLIEPDQPLANEKRNRIPARISQMIHERSTDSILMTCQAGGQLFWVRWDRSSRNGPPLFPGREIRLSFPIEAIEPLPRT